MKLDTHIYIGRWRDIYSLILDLIICFFFLIFYAIGRIEPEIKEEKNKIKKSLRVFGQRRAGRALGRYLQCTGASFLYHITSHHVFKRGCVPSFVSLFFPPPFQQQQQLSTIPPFYFFFFLKSRHRMYICIIWRGKKGKKEWPFWLKSCTLYKFAFQWLLSTSRTTGGGSHMRWTGHCSFPSLVYTKKKNGGKKKMYIVKWTKKRAS